MNSIRLRCTAQWKPDQRPAIYWTFMGALLAVALGGCQQTHVRVINDVTDEPIAGATVIAMEANIFGSPSDGGEAVSGKDGRATVWHGGDLLGLEVKHSLFRRVSPRDKVSTAGDEALLYMRLPPRVVLMLTDGFSGPMLVTFASGNREFREATYRVSMSTDLYKPTVVPCGGLIQLKEIEAEADGIAIPPVPASPDPAKVYVWVPAFCYRSIFFEHQFLDLIFVGTQQQFRTFERAMEALPGPQGTTKTLDRASMDELRTAVAKSNGGTEEERKGGLH